MYMLHIYSAFCKFTCTVHVLILFCPSFLLPSPSLLSPLNLLAPPVAAKEKTDLEGTCTCTVHVQYIYMYDQSPSIHGHGHVVLLCVPLLQNC